MKEVAVNWVKISSIRLIQRKIWRMVDTWTHLAYRNIKGFDVMVRLREIFISLTYTWENFLSARALGCFSLQCVSYYKRNVFHNVLRYPLSNTHILSLSLSQKKSVRRKSERQMRLFCSPTQWLTYDELLLCWKSHLLSSPLYTKTQLALNIARIMLLNG